MAIRGLKDVHSNKSEYVWKTTIVNGTIIRKKVLKKVQDNNKYSYEGFNQTNVYSDYLLVSIDDAEFFFSLFIIILCFCMIASFYLGRAASNIKMLHNRNQYSYTDTLYIGRGRE